MLSALVNGVPDDEDEQKTGIINLIFMSDPQLSSKEFIDRCASERCNWIFQPNEIRKRLR